MRSNTPFPFVVGALITLAAAAAIFLGSRGMVHFDPALTGYAAGTLLAVFAAGYRFTVWAQRPPSRMYFRRGLQLLFRSVASPAKNNNREQFNDSTVQRIDAPLSHGAGTLGFSLARNFVAQEFIRRRGPFRWIMHLCLSGGCTLAFAITFPLVFGWVHFESFQDNAEMYRVKVFGLGVDSFDVHSLKAHLM